VTRLPLVGAYWIQGLLKNVWASRIILLYMILHPKNHASINFVDLSLGSSVSCMHMISTGASLIVVSCWISSKLYPFEVLSLVFIQPSNFDLLF
jgi:hypothetical protein